MFTAVTVTTQVLPGSPTCHPWLTGNSETISEENGKGVNNSGNVFR